MKAPERLPVSGRGLVSSEVHPHRNRVWVARVAVRCPQEWYRSSGALARGDWWAARRPAIAGRASIPSGQPLRIISAAFSAIIMVAALVLPEITVGITEASATRSPSTP